MPVPVAEALLYIMALWGVFLLFRVLRFPDISADSVFSLGSISGAFAYFLTDSITVAFVGAFLAGTLAGAITSAIFSFCQVPKLLAGVVVYAGLFSVNLKFFDRPNISLPSDSSHVSQLIIICVLDAVILIALTYGLSTRLGNSWVALGSNPLVLGELSAPRSLILALGMGLANGLIAVSGLMTSFYFGFSDVSIGAGVLVNSVAALIIGERLASYFKRSLRCAVLLLGAIAYYGLVYVVIRYISFGVLSYSDYKLVSGAVIVCVFLLHKGKHEDLVPL